MLQVCSMSQGRYNTGVKREDSHIFFLLAVAPKGVKPPLPLRKKAFFIKGKNGRQKNENH